MTLAAGDHQDAAGVSRRVGRRGGISDDEMLRAVRPPADLQGPLHDAFIACLEPGHCLRSQSLRLGLYLQNVRQYYFLSVFLNTRKFEIRGYGIVLSVHRGVTPCTRVPPLDCKECPPPHPLAPCTGGTPPYLRSFLVLHAPGQMSR